MIERDSIKFAKGFGYKTQDVDQWIDKLTSTIEELENDLKSKKQELSALREKSQQFEKELTEQRDEGQKLKQDELTRINDFSSLMDNGKKIVNQMKEDAKLEAAEIIYNARKVLLESEEEAERIKNRSMHDVKNMSALLAEISKISAKSKEQVNVLYTQIDDHYQEFISEIQRKAAEILEKKEQQANSAEEQTEVAPEVSSDHQ